MRNIKEILVVILIYALSVPQVFSDTTTTRFGLTKPDVGSTNWGPKINTNSDTIDNAAGLSLSNTYTNTNTYNGPVNLNQTVTVSTTIAGTPTFSGTVTHNGATTFNGATSFTQPVTISSNATLSGSSTFSGNTTFNAGTTMTISTQALAADGSVSAPSYSFGNNKNLGLYRIGSSNLGLSIAGVKQWDISASNNIITQGDFNVNSGASPNLYVTSTAGSGAQIRILASGSTAGYIQTQSNHPLVFTTNNGADAIRIYTDQTVGFGAGGSNSALISTLKFPTDTTPTRWAGIQGFRGGDAANIDLRFFTMNGDSGGVLERMRILNTGQVAPYYGILGTTTNDSATAGNVGEQQRTSVTSGVSAPATLQFFDICSSTLTAGDWDITGQVIFTLNGATQSVALMAITSTAGNSVTGQIDGDNRLPVTVPASSNDSSGTIANYRVSLSGTTIYYLKARCDYSAGTPKAYGRISARRIR